MYIPAAFAAPDRDTLLELVRANSFATIAAVIGGSVRLAYAPALFIDGAPHGRVQFHLARANPVASVEEGATVTLSFPGPHAYISPRWYDSAEQVPTWNYVAVEAVGRIRRLNDEELRTQLGALAALHESELGGDDPWSPAKLTAARFAALLGAISGFEVQLVSLEGKLKLSQNRTRSDIQGAVAGLMQRGDPASLAIAAAMQKRLDSI